MLIENAIEYIRVDVRYFGLSGEVKFSASVVEWRCGVVVSVKSGHQNSPVGLFGAQLRAFWLDSGLSFSVQVSGGGEGGSSFHPPLTN